MKKLLTLITLFTLIHFSKAHAQTAQNSAVKITYVGYSAGLHSLKIETLQDCPTEIRFRYNNGAADLIHTQNGRTIQTVTLADPAHSKTYIEFKTSTNCSGGTNATWINLSMVPVNLAVHVTSFNAKPHNGGVMVLFKTKITDGDFFEVERCSENGVWRRLAIIRNDDTHYLLDMTAEPGVNRYRLKLHQASQITYSHTVSVTLKGERDTARLYSASGAYMGEVDLQAVHVSRLMHQSLPRGVYFAKTKSGTRKLYKP